MTDYEYDAHNRLVSLAHLPGWDAEFPLIAAPFAQFDYQLRADGKRTSATERVLEVDSGGQTAARTNTFAWEYDALGRLVDEVFTTELDYDGYYWQPLDEGAARAMQDYRDHYQFDLAGNRLRKTTDLDLSTSEVDEVITYFYDANDRLLEEKRDLGADNVVDELISYGYDFTQQTEKRVETTDVPPVLKQLVRHQYDLQGRLQTTSIEDFAAGGTTVVRRETTTFDYDHTGIRVSSHNRLEKYDDTTEQLEPRHDLDTSYLVDHDNFTGYAQVLRETTSTTTGQTVREVVYTLGHDVISQWSNGAIYTYFDGEVSNEFLIPVGSHAFLYDGHGSNRGLVPRGDTALNTGQIVDRSFTYDAYGNAVGFNPQYAGTSLLYSGEQFDQRVQMQYLRARWYDPAAGRFNRLDPPLFANLSDPLSLHKYAYVHGDPVNGIDPGGLFTQAFGLAAEAAIIADHRLAFPFPFEVTYGQWARLPGALQVKPDILNLTDRTYNEIKPLSPSGIIAAAAQMILRDFQLGANGFEPDTQWPITPRVTTVGVVPVLYFNLAGVIFYTDALDLAEDVALARALGFQAAWSLLASRASTLVTAIERIPQLLAGSRGVDSGRLQGHVSIGAMLAMMGFA